METKTSKPAPKVLVAAWVSPATAAELRELARSEERPVSYIVRKLIEGRVARWRKGRA